MILFSTVVLTDLCITKWGKTFHLNKRRGRTDFGSVHWFFCLGIEYVTLEAPDEEKPLG